MRLWHSALLAGLALLDYPRHTNACCGHPSLKSDPELLERRIKYREKEKEQQAIVSIGLCCLCCRIIAIAIDLRQHGLDTVPTGWILIADLGIFLGYLLILWVFKEKQLCIPYP